MARTDWIRRAGAAAAALLLTATLAVSGCGGEHCCPPEMTFSGLPDCLAAADGPVALAVGARANQPMPQVPEKIGTLMMKASYHGKRISVLRVDGDPQVVGGAEFASTAKNTIAWQRDLEGFVKTLNQAISTVKATKPEANPLEALARASEQVGSGGTVVVLDSGLQTLPPLDFRAKGLLDAEPKEIVDFLERYNNLPKLEGRQVVLVGIGMTAEPQKSLDTARRKNLLAIWQEIARRGGAKCVEVDAQQRKETPATDVGQVVSPVDVPPPVNVPADCSETILRDGGSVKFRPDSATFVDEAAARDALSALADRIIAGRLTVKLTGTTSSWGNSAEGKRKLSRERADAVKQILVGHGVPGDRISTDGVGYPYPGSVNDRDGKGNLIPDLAAQNRNVIVQLSGCDHG